jgi:hypothetical protein
MRQASRIVVIVLCTGLLLADANRAEGQDAFAGVWRAGDDPYYLVDGSNKWVRLSTLEFSGAPFTLPFSNTSVKRWNG